ncbi:MAG: TrkH family potassium uptake protein [Phycisphaerae bacterium]
MVQITGHEAPLSRRQKIRAAMDWLLLVTAAAAMASLVLEHGGFRPYPLPLPWLHTINAVIVGIFVLDRFARIFLSDHPRDYLRQNWIDFALMGLVAVAFAMAYNYGSILAVSALYIIISEVYILVVLVLRGVGANIRLSGLGIPSSWLLIGSFALLCLLGMGLLLLPSASPGEDSPYHRPMYAIDALFTSVSATCVTGLIVRDTGLQFTIFGQAVILGLIQLGGLGIMTFGTLFALLAGKGLGMRESSTLGEVLGAEIGSLQRVVGFVVLTTVSLEAAGAVLMYPMFLGSVSDSGQVLTPALAAWYSVFHSVSAFCNAGFALHSDSLIGLRDQLQVLGVFCPLIVLGGLGFPVLQDLARAAKGWIRALRHWLNRRPGKGPLQVVRTRFNLHTKVVLTTTAVLLVLGAVTLYVLETPGRTEPALGRHAMGGDAESIRVGMQGMGWLERARAAVFQSVTARTAGFNTVDMDELSDGGKLWMCLLMIVGGSPASTAGGMKTVALAVLVIAGYSILRQRRSVEAFRRTISPTLVAKTVTLAILYVGLLITVTLLLCYDMRSHAFIDLFFEACSACGTVGLSTGITGRLTDFGKGVIIAAMFLGRLGPLTLLLAVTARLREVKYSYATEDVTIG